MIILGTALLAACTLFGVIVGSILGMLIGIPANVGGIGISMVTLILVGSYLKRTGKLVLDVESGIKYWAAIYIPVVVAMAAKQNVFGAVSGGAMAISAGVVSVLVGFLLVPIINKSFSKSNATQPSEENAS